MNEHPGGDLLLLDRAGDDATIEFEGQEHSADAKEILKGKLIGCLKKEWLLQNKSLFLRKCDKILYLENVIKDLVVLLGKCDKLVVNKFIGVAFLKMLRLIKKIEASIKLIKCVEEF